MKIPALVVLLAVNAAAQPDPAELAQANAAASELAKEARQAAVVQTVLADMAQGEMGAEIVAYLRANGGQVSMHTHAEPVNFVLAGGKPLIFLSDALGSDSKTLGPLIANVVAGLMYYHDMPQCAEASYMVRGATARVFVELGGTKADLPVKVPAIQEQIGVWMQDNVEMALYQISQSAKLPIIPELESRAKTDAERAELVAANKRFAFFLWDERPIRKQAGLR